MHDFGAGNLTDQLLDVEFGQTLEIKLRHYFAGRFVNLFSEWLQTLIWQMAQKHKLVQHPAQAFFRLFLAANHVNQVSCELSKLDWVLKGKPFPVTKVDHLQIIMRVVHANLFR